MPYIKYPGLDAKQGVNKACLIHKEQDVRCSMISDSCE